LVENIRIAKIRDDDEIEFDDITTTCANAFKDTAVFLNGKGIIVEDVLRGMTISLGYLIQEAFRPEDTDSEREMIYKQICGTIKTTMDIVREDHNEDR